MESLSEAGIAPYGEHVVVRPWWRVLGQYFVEPVFAGYCVGGVNVAWGSSESLAIRCRAGKIVKQEAASDGVQVEYAIVE